MSKQTLPNFEYHEPKTVSELLKLLDTYGDEAKIIAGGTDLIPKMRGGVITVKHLISLKNVKELDFIHYDDTSGLTFGAATKIRKLEKNQAVISNYKALYEGAHSIASTQIRNAGTIVGNICNAVPSADSAPSLLVLGAKLKVVSIDGERIVPIEEFFTGVCKTVLKPNEMVTEVNVPPMEDKGASKYFKYSIRRALDLALVGVSAKIVMGDGVCKDAKIALGAVSITPKRAYEAEKMLIGKKLTDDLINEVALFTSENECSPISDVRSSKEYRRNMVRILTRDAIKSSIVD